MEDSHKDSDLCAGFHKRGQDGKTAGYIEGYCGLILLDRYVIIKMVIIMNRIVIDELKRRISSVQMVPVKHCTELKLEA